jgi:hypothetical protein
MEVWHRRSGAKVETGLEKNKGGNFGIWNKVRGIKLNKGVTSAKTCSFVSDWGRQVAFLLKIQARLIGTR